MQHLSIGRRLVCGALSLCAIVGLSVGPALSQEPDRVQVLIAFDHPPGAQEEALVRAANGSITYTYSLVPAIAATVPETAIAGLLLNPNVLRVELDGQIQATSHTSGVWGVDRIGAGLVHHDGDTITTLGNKGAGVIVAVIDSGIDYTHLDLDANYVGGYDFVNTDTDPMDDFGHGTHLAGIIAAEDDGVGVVGVAPEAGLVALKVLDSTGNGLFSSVVAALDWIVLYNADNPVGEPDILVTNNSFEEKSDPGETVRLAYENSYNLGILHVAGAGNRGRLFGPRRDDVGYPAAFASNIAVTATDQSDTIGLLSASGPDAELAAPGEEIYSTLPGDNYGLKSGTSMAAPHVAGTAALVIAAGLVSGPDQVRQSMNETAEDLGAAGRDDLYGYGLVDAEVAVQFTAGPDLPPFNVAITQPTDGNTVSGQVDVIAAADDDVGVNQVEFFAGGASIGFGSLNNGSWSRAWDTCSESEGAVGLTVVATDTISQTTASDVVNVTVDNATSGACETDPGGDFTLTVTGYKVRGAQKADLTWSGATSANVDVFRDGSLLSTTANDGTYTDNIDQRGGGSYTYQVCEAVADGACSNDFVVTF